MPQLVQHNQSAFIKGTTIHDNFRSVQSATKATSHLYVLLKIDIARAFDTVSCLFLLELLSYVGFSRRWTN
jgi:hypothetical protein